MKKLLRLLSIVFVNILICFTLMEVSLRLFPGLIPPSFFRHFSDSLRSKIAQQRNMLNRLDIVFIERDDGGPDLFIFKPFVRMGGATMDRLGFCNLPQNGYDVHQTFDIIAIGDSFTYCWEVRLESAWPSQLSLLTGYTVYNLGVPTAGIYEYLQLFKKFGVRKSSKAVIMNVFEGNDLRDAVKYQRYRESFGRSEITSSKTTATQTPALRLSPPRRIFYFLRESALGRYSYAFNLALTSIGIVASTTSNTDENFNYRLVFPEIEIAFNSGNTDVDEALYGKLLREEKVNLEVFTEALQAYIELSQQQNFIPIVTYMPSAHTVYADHVVFEDSTLAGLMPWIHREQLNYFQAKGKELGYIFIDLTSTLQAAAQSSGAQNLLYLSDDLHLTAFGHTVVAKAISQVLQSLPLVETVR